MKDDQKKKIMLGVLMLAAVGVVVYQLMFAGGPTPPPPPPGGGAPKTAAAPATKTAAATPGPRLKQVEINIDELLQSVREVTFDYNVMRISRNPYTPLVGGPLSQNVPAEGGVISAPSQLEVMRKKITGIVYDEFNPLAVVDDEVIGIGHVYPNGTKVYSIERDKVVFQLGDSLVPVEMEE